MDTENPNLNETESDFRRLLQDVQESRAPIDALLGDETFDKRLRLIVMTFARTEVEADELANDVRMKVWQYLPRFDPNHDRPYAAFFAWLRAVTQNTFFNTHRESKLELVDQSIEDLEIADTQTDIEQSLIFKEVMAEFEKSIEALPPREQLAVAYYLQGYSTRETSEKLREAGFSSSHVTVRRWIRDGLKASRAKKVFYTILEQAIDSGIANVSGNIYRTPLPVVRQTSSETTQPTPRLGWQLANDLLSSMQTAESKRGIQAAFDASPEELGQAAVDLANKRRKIPIVSLTTFLMATSTVSVLGRVMNLSKDAA